MPGGEAAVVLLLHEVPLGMFTGALMSGSIHQDVLITRGRCLCKQAYSSQTIQKWIQWEEFSGDVGELDQQGKKIAMTTAKAAHLPRSIGKEGVAGLCLIAENNGNHELLTVAASFSPCSLT